MNYTFLDAEERAKQHPDTFTIQPRAERDDIPAGHFAKIGFCPTKPQPAGAPSMERMWVLISKATIRSGKPTIYLGTLNNDPILDYGDGLKDGDLIIFTSTHVLDHMEPNGDV